jgi:hypothetical protein
MNQAKMQVDMRCVSLKIRKIEEDKNFGQLTFIEKVMLV